MLSYGLTLLLHVLNTTTFEYRVKATGTAISYSKGLRLANPVWGCEREAIRIAGNALFDPNIDAIALQSDDLCGKFVIIENFGNKRKLFLVQLGVIGRDCAKGPYQVCLTPPAARLLGLSGKGDDYRGSVIVRVFNELKARLSCLMRIGGFCLSVSANMHNYARIP